jgi:hypothetical protein
LNGAPSHPLDRLSAAALHHVAAIPGLVDQAAADRLYRMNSQPLTPALMRSLPDAEAAARYLGLAPPPAPYRAVADAHWLHFRHPAAAGPLVHKLYVSTRLTALPALLALALPLLAANAVPSFKLGAHAAGLARCDHFVLHFASPDHRDHVATELAILLVPPAGPRLPPLGVPFAAAVVADPAGLIGSGFDPPEHSHRSWITTVMAAALGPAGAAAGARAAAMRSAVQAAGLCPDRFVPLRGPMPA